MHLRFGVVIVAVLLLLGCDEWPPAGTAGPPPETTLVAIDAAPADPVAGQVLYVPVYSHIYMVDFRRDFNLAVTLAIRNTSLEHPIVITSARYYDDHGTVIREFVSGPHRLDPMASTEIVIAESDRTGGSGANFIVEWVAADPVPDPVVETVMIGTVGQQGISFLSTGRVVEELRSASSQ